VKARKGVEDQTYPVLIGGNVSIRFTCMVGEGSDCEDRDKGERGSRPKFRREGGKEV